MDKLDLRRAWITIVIASAWAAILACEIPGLTATPTKPLVVISSPASGTQVFLGEEVLVESLATSEKGVDKVELWVDGALVLSDQSPMPQPSYALVQRWTPAAPGIYILEVRAYDVEGVASHLAVVEVTVAATTPVTQTPTPLPPEVWPISTDEYVFIDHHIHTHGDLIMGAYQELMIDFPTYQFDQEAGTLMGSIDFEIDEELKVIFGSGSSLSGCAGGGAATRLTGVYEVPYERDGFTIERIEPDGTAYIEYDGESIVLASGEEWVKEESRFDTQPPLGVARLTTTDKIVNYGILDKSGIEEW